MLDVAKQHPAHRWTRGGTIRGHRIEERGPELSATNELACECDEEDALAALRVLQMIVPVGCAARDYRESFLLQLRALRESGTGIPEPVEQIIVDHLNDLAAGRFAHIGNALGVPMEAVEQARAFIRAHLTPHPLQTPQAHPGRRPTSSAGDSRPD